MVVEIIARGRLRAALRTHGLRGRSAHTQHAGVVEHITRKRGSRWSSRYARVRAGLMGKEVETKAHEYHVYISFGVVFILECRR